MQEGLAAFCVREHPRLVGALHLLTGSREVAEDLAQETLARVCRDWRRIGELGAPGAYAHRVAVNLAASEFRRRAAERRAARRAASLGYGVDDAPQGATDEADRIALERALGVLRPVQRQVLVLRFYLGYTVAEAARVLGVPEGTVKTHTHRGVECLRAALGVDVLTKGRSDA